MFCMNCGKQIPDMSAFCQYCGNAVAAFQQPQAQMPQAVPQAAPQAQMPQAVPQAAPQMPQPAPVPQVAPQPAPVYSQAPQQVQPQYNAVPQQPVYAPQPQAVPQMQAAPQAVPQMPQAVPVQADPSVILEPICVSLLTPKNAQKDRLKLENAAMYYIEIRNNTLIISGKGGAASYMFGAVGALVTAAACDIKPITSFAPSQIRNMTYGKKFGDILIVELFDGKLLEIKTKLEVLNTVENWWRSQLV